MLRNIVLEHSAVTFIVSTFVIHLKYLVARKKNVSLSSDKKKKIAFLCQSVMLCHLLDK